MMRHKKIYEFGSKNLCCWHCERKKSSHYWKYYIFLCCRLKRFEYVRNARVVSREIRENEKEYLFTFAQEDRKSFRCHRF